MKTLRIKCPSCGVILEVRNSKDETVKRITCPNCKKQLLVDFADVPKPKLKPSDLGGALYEGEIRHPLIMGANPLPHIASDIAEVKGVCVLSGYKYTLRVLSDKQQVTVNGQPLLQDDEVVLIHGDEIEVGGYIFTFGKPGKQAQMPEQIKEDHVKEPEKAPAKKPALNWILLTIVIALMAGGAIWYYYPSSKQKLVVPSDTVLVTHDTISPKRTSDKQVSTKPSIKSKKEVLQQQDPKPTESVANDFDLETKAAKGDINAQYQLGMRWVTSNDCVEVVKGVKYLELAARNGYANAQYALGIIYHKGSPACGINRNPTLARQYMQMAANKGLEKAKRFLESNSE